jgi:GNAT superfamily N-acetyltransferase
MCIYQDEFPRNSRLSIRKIRQLLKSGRYQLFVTHDRDQVHGFALVWVCPQPAFVHLDYIAVRQGQQGRGIGTTLYRWLIDHLDEFSPQASLLTLEVEDELVPFYRRSFTQILHNVPYLFPGRSGPIPMHLMVYDRRHRKTLERILVQGIIRALYRGIHNRDAKDPILQSFLSRVPRRVSLV